MQDLIDKLSEQNSTNGIQNPGIKIKEVILPELREMWDELVKKDN